MATANGQIRSADYDRDAYGNRVIIEHDNGFVTSYSQMESYVTKPKQQLKRGDIIG